ncbi:MAG: AMP-binding protein, partial [bacterium]|nr:AMP-binding protein [bacterium]
YTSGSTGKPKGTLTTHANVIRVVRDTNYIDITADDRLLQLSNYAFDGSVFDIYGALLNGAALVLPERGQALSADRLAAFIFGEMISVFFVTTALFNVLVDVAVEGFQHVRKVLFGGERVSVAHVRKAFQFMGKGRILHVYGPTETTVYATYYVVEDLEEQMGTIPIGKPIANTTVYIMDSRMNPVPIGVTGEVFIGGDGVSRGYLNNPELTEANFYRSYKSYRTYKTGDLARWLPDGNIEFIGRRDHQVKIRGFRIEMGEIERKLLSHKDVTEAVVIAVEQQQLCAYIVAKSDVNLRDFLAQTLPDYMIPDYFVRLDKLPLTSTGKIDRKALPTPEIKTTADHIAPRGETEIKLAQLWAEVLKIEPDVIGIHSNFFRLGGHSLKAAILINKINTEFGITLKLKNLFDLSTIKGISALLAGDAISSGGGKVEPVEKKEYYPLSSAQERLYIVTQMDETGTGYNMPVYFQIRGNVDKDRLETIFRMLIKRHESLRTSFHMVEDQPVQRIHPETDFKIDIINNFVRPFDLSEAPLLRVVLTKTGKEKYLLMVDTHHIISDGLSIGIFMRDFKALYQGRELPTPTLQYKDFSAWQNELVVSPEMKEREAFWLNMFQGEIPVLNLPADFPRPPVQGFVGSTFRSRIGKEVTSGLNRLVLENGVTMYMVLLAAFNVFLWKLTGGEDIVVGSPTAGRRHNDLETIMGMFVNTLVLRNSPEGNMSFNAFLGDVKERSLQALENQDYPFDELVRKVAPRQDASRNPLFDVIFGLENEADPTGYLMEVAIPD